MPHLETRQNGVGSEGSPAVFGTTSDDATPTVGAVEEILVKSSVARPSGVLDALQQQYPRRSWKLLKRKESWQSAAVAVVSAEGTRIAENAEEWLKREAPTDRARYMLANTIAKDGTALSRKERQAAYAIGLDPQDPLNFVQVKFFRETELLCSADKLEPLSWSRDIESLPWGNALRSAPVLVSGDQDIVHSLRWLELCKATNVMERQRQLRRLEEIVVQQRLPSGEKSQPVPLLQHDPKIADVTKRPCREERWFNDWRRSSAGELPMGEHWILDTHDFTDKEGVRHVGFIPRAVVWPATISPTRKSPKPLMDDLARLDDRTKCRFGWYFHMVYGNRVSHHAAEIVIAGIRRGAISLPTRDQAILMDWAADPYRF